MGGARLGPGWPSKSWADPGFQVSGGGGGGGGGDGFEDLDIDIVGVLFWGAFVEQVCV